MQTYSKSKNTNLNTIKEDVILKLKNKHQNIPNMKATHSNNLEKEPSSTCPKHLIVKKIEDLDKLFKDKKYYELLTTLNELKREYGNDEKIVRIITIYLFKLLTLTNKLKDIDLLQFIFNKAEENFFDSILCSYVFGLLVFLESKTKEDIIKKIGNRMLKMAPDILRKVINLIPNNAYHQNILNEFKNKLNKLNNT